MPVKRLALLVVALLVFTGCQAKAPPVTQTGKVAVPEIPAYQQTEQHKQALALVGKGDYPGAEALLKQVVAEQPKAAEAWNDLSFVQAQLDHWPDSAQSARKALEVNPTFAFAEYNLGWALLHTNDWKTAKPYLETSAELQPDRPEPLYALGEWYRMSGSAVEAAEQYRKASAMGYQPAQDQLAAINVRQAKEQDAAVAIAAFANVPVQAV
jgi:tetratricopeptide (TPR) repeat protein